MTPPTPDPRATAVAEPLSKRLLAHAVAWRYLGYANRAFEAERAAAMCKAIEERESSAALADAKRETLTDVVALAEAELQNARDNPLQPYDYYLSTLVNALRQLKLRAQENPRG